MIAAETPLVTPLLEAAGWTVVRITWLELTEEPDAVAARLALALQRPSGQLAA